MRLVATVVVIPSHLAQIPISAVWPGRSRTAGELPFCLCRQTRPAVLLRVNLLYKLLAYPERTFTRLELLDEIWGMDSESDEKTVNVHINRLRTRFYDWPEFEIQTVRGMGYRAVKKV